MARAGDLTAPRLQFRLDLTDPEQQAIYDELMAMPKGRRNTEIVRRLQRGNDLEDIVYGAVRRALRDANTWIGGVDLSPSGSQDMTLGAAAKLPDELFNTKLFTGKV